MRQKQDQIAKKVLEWSLEKILLPYSEEAKEKLLKLKELVHLLPSDQGRKKQQEVH